MPLPLLFIGIAAGTGIVGAGTTAKAAVDNFKAEEINTKVNADIDYANNVLEFQRDAVSESLQQLGELKLNILTGSIAEFVNTFERIKNIDFIPSDGIEELEKLQIDESDIKELKELGDFAQQVIKGVSAGIAGGALTAFAAYTAVTYFATASTGTAISALGGVATTNATLAFFGGGSLAAGGLGTTAGITLLGGLVAGPALLVMGIITVSKAQEKLEKALTNKAEATVIIETLDNVSNQCASIRRRTNMFYNLLAHLDTYFLPQVWKMKDIVDSEGTEYGKYSNDSKKVIMAAASTAGSIKAVLDTAILSEEGALTEESHQIIKRIEEIIYQ